MRHHMTDATYARQSFNEKIVSQRAHLEWLRAYRRDRIKVAFQTLGFAICVSVYIFFSASGLMKAYISAPSATQVSASRR